MTSSHPIPIFCSATPVASTRSTISPMPRSSLRAGMIIESEGILSGGIASIKVGFWPGARDAGAYTHLPQHPSRHSANHRMRRHIVRHHGPSRNHCSPSDVHAAGDHRARPHPPLIFDDDPLTPDALLNKWSPGIIKNMVDGNNLGVG